MSFWYFLLLALCFTYVSAGAAPVTTPARPGANCPYDGKIDPKCAQKLNSPEFQNSLSPIAYKFLQKIPSLNFFFKLFDTSFKKGTVQRTYYLNCVYWETKMELKCPIKLCEKMADKIAGAYESTDITPLDSFKALAGTIETALGKLDSKSQDEILKRFVDNLANRVCKREVKGPNEALFALDGGTIDLYRELDVNNRKDLSDVANEFGNQYAEIAKNPVFLDLKIVIGK